MQIEDIKNNIDFWLREKTKFSRKNYCEKNTEVLLYNYRENLYTFDILSRYFTQNAKKNASVLDIGSKNWFYAKGEYNFFKTFCEDFELDGVEIDAHRLYSNFYSRYETAMFYTKGLEKTNYIAGDLLSINKKYDYIIWFLPFVFEEPLKKWGLPKKHFKPEVLLSHACTLLKEGGEMLIVNQGKLEYERQKELLVLKNLTFQELGLIESEFLSYKNQRFGFLVKK